MADPITMARAATLLLTNEKTRKGIGWALVAILSPVILVLVFLLVLASGGAANNISAVELCFNGGDIPDSYEAVYRVYIQEMRDSFALLDEAITEVNGQIEEAGTSLDAIRVKAVFFSLYFGADGLSDVNRQQFVDCFMVYETKTRAVTTTDEDGNEMETEETYSAGTPIEDIAQVYENIMNNLGVVATTEQRANADSIYNLIRYGIIGDSGSGFPGSDVPFIGADGFCSPVGENWRSIVTSEFGSRADPFTGQRMVHTGIDLAVPYGTPVRAALDGVVTVSTYHSSHGYYVVIDHGSGLSTLYGHNSRLLVHVGQTVHAGDVISQSGSTGRSTGPHLHFEVWVNGERTDPRNHLP